MERQIMKNALNLAIHSPNEFVYQIMKRYMAITSGEIVHNIKCTQVEVKIRHEKECYQPVLRENETYFLAPRTHILFKTGTQITCNRIIPSMYFLHDGWYKIALIPEMSIPPLTMTPMMKPTLS